MDVNVLFFGMIRDIAGSNNLLLNNAHDTDEVIEQLQTMFPQLKNTKYRVAVNKNLIHDNATLPDGAEVAILPPFSGG